MPFEEDKSNGILAQIRGQYIAAAQNSLPPAGPDQPKYLTEVIDVPDMGRVRITFELMSHRHGRIRSRFWTACFAEAA